jgi:predicted NACHT family NTPase
MENTKVENIIKLIKEANIELAFEKIEFLSAKDHKHSLEINTLSSRFNDLKHQNSLGTISNENYNIERNSIVANLLNTVTEIGKNNEIEKSNSYDIFKRNKPLEKLISEITGTKLRDLIKIKLLEQPHLSDEEEERRERQNYTESEEILYALKLHLTKVFNWSKEISFKDLNKSKAISKIYIDLDLYLTPTRQNLIKDFDKVDKTKLSELIEENESHIMILGHPGAGKTTSMQHLCQSILKKGIRKYEVPLLIRLRELNPSNPRNYDKEESNLINQIYDIFDIQIKFDPKDSKRYIKSTKEKIVYYLLENLKPIIVLDGYDEIVNNQQRRDLISDLRELCLKAKGAKVILTSRIADFQFNIENSISYEICPLNNNQIKDFTFKWLGDKEKAQDLQRQIFSSPFSDTAIRPLTLAHLSAIFERYGKIPDKPKTVYRKIINLLLEEWDAQRSIKRISKYSNFETDRKFEFLSNLAYSLTTQYSTSTFGKRNLSEIYKSICSDFHLPEAEVIDVVDELESHSGLFVQAGYDWYEFAHKSLQEYLTAEYVVKFPIIPEDVHFLNKLPNELALVIAISSNPTLYFSILILQRFKSKILDGDFLESFLNRLIIEKPDFKSNPLLIISILFIFKVTLGNNAQKRNLNKANLSKKQSETLRLIDDFFNIKEVQESIPKFLNYYKPKSAVQMGRNELIQFNKLRNVDGINSGLQPNILYGKPEYFEKRRKTVSNKA